MKKYIKDNYIKIILFVFLLGIAIFIPYVHDDWAWASSFGMKLLNNKFYDYNGRYISNLIAILLCKYKVIMIIIFTLSSYMIFYLMNKFLKLRNDIYYLIIVILFFLMPAYTLFQGYIWVSGYVNYTLSMLPILTYLYFNRDIFNNKYSKDSVIKIVMFFILGIISSLFVEHITLYNLVLSLFILIVNLIRKQRLSISNLLYFIGSLVGAIIMFSNSAYLKVLNNNDSYRSIDNIKNIINKLSEEIIPYMIHKNIIIIIVIEIMIFIISYKLLKNKSIKNNKLKYMVFIYNIVFLMYNLILTLNPFWDIVSNVNIFNMINSIIWYIFLILFVCLFIEKNRRFRMLFLLASIFIMIIPLLVVNPVGPRCFLPMYLFYIMFILDLIDYISVNKCVNIDKKFIKIVVCLSSLMVIIFILTIYGYVFKVYVIRNKIIDKYKDNDYICIPNLPYNYKYLHCSEPINEHFEKVFKDYYGIKENTKIEFDSLERCTLKNK